MRRFRARWSQFEMWMRRHPLAFAAAVLVGLGLLAFLAPVKLQQEALAPSDEQAKIYFGGRDSVGQSFMPLPGLQELRLPVGRSEDAMGPVILHLREDYFGEDIRSAVVFVLPADTEELLFQFAAIRRPPERLVWVLEAPHGPRRSYWAYREQDAAAYPTGEAFVNGKRLRGNFAFMQTGSQPKILAGSFNLSVDAQSWEKASLVAFAVGFVLFLLLAPWARRHAARTWLWVGGLVLATLVFHAWFARQLPLIIDEGAYLQDAVQTTKTFWPLRDFLTKGPIYVLLLKLWWAAVPETLAAWRLFSAVSWAGVVAGVALLARRLGLSARAQVLAAALLALLPGVVSVTTPLLLQVTSTLFVVMAMLALAKGAQELRPRFIVFGALLMSAAYLTRSSTAAAGVAGAVLVWLFTPGRFQARGRAVATYIGIGLLAMAAVAGAALPIMGVERTAVLFNIEALAVGKLQAAQTSGTEPVIRWVTQAAEILWRGGSWLIAGVVALPLLFLRRLPVWARVGLLGLAGVVFANMAYHLSDMGYLLPGVLLPTRITMLIIVFGIPLAWAASLLLNGGQGSGPAVPRAWLAVCVVWVGALVLLYRGWGAYRAQYIVEFLPPLALMAGAALAQGWQVLRKRWLAQALVAGLFVASWWQGTFLLAARPISGTITPEAVAALAELIRREVPAGEHVFTAQPIVTAASGRPIIAGYSHPGWILYSRLGEVPDELRQIYFADEDEITRWLAHETRFVVTGHRTDEIYFDYSPERQQILKEQFELVGEVPNDLTEVPFRLYRRK